MQAQLHFSGAYGHSHHDNLNLTLFAKGSEMLPDLGYTWTQMRHWTLCTPGHNTVVVDRTDQTSRESDGDLLGFFPDADGVGVVEADGRRGYGEIEGLDLYRRILAMIPVSESDAYVVDIFRVRGGEIHDWTLHGDADENTTATCSLSLDEPRKWMLEAGEAWDEPTMQGAKFNPYGMIRDVRRGESNGIARIDFAYDAETEKGIRVHMIACSEGESEDAEIWLGRAPSVRRMGKGTQGDMRKAYDFWMPQLLVRCRGEAPLASTFAAVEEPFSGTPFVEHVELLTLTPADSQAVALQVTHAGGVDTIISTLDEPPYPERVTSSGIGLKGRLGVVRQVKGKTIAVWLFEGEELAAGDRRLDAQRSRHEGEVVGATRKSDSSEQDAFIVDADVPEGESLRGTWMIVTHGNGFTHGYEIDRVETRDGKKVIVLTHDHGLRIDGDTTQEVYCPLREIKGRNSFVIPLAMTAREMV